MIKLFYRIGFMVLLYLPHVIIIFLAWLASLRFIPKYCPQWPNASLPEIPLSLNGAKTFSITTLRIMTLRTKNLTFDINRTGNSVLLCWVFLFLLWYYAWRGYAGCRYDGCHYAECYSILWMVIRKSVWWALLCHHFFSRVQCLKTFWVIKRIA